MRIIVDANRFIAALIKDGTTRNLFFEQDFEFFAPEYIHGEIIKYREEISNKIGISLEELDILISIIFERVKIILEKDYHLLAEGLNNQISDFKDIPYLAVCLHLNAEGIWTHDPHFNEQDKVKVFTNIDMLRLCAKADFDFGM